MTMRPVAEQPNSEIAVRIVGSNTFGRNDKMSSERTYNMMIADDWLVQTPGYKKQLTISSTGFGRGGFSSTRGNFMLVVIENMVYRVSGPKTALNFQFIFMIDTFFGDVSIDENIAYQITICDSQALWVYNWNTNMVTKATLPTNTQTGNPIVPGFVTFHDGYTIVPDTTSASWYLSPLNNPAGNWEWGGGSTPVFGTIQTKPDFAEAVLRAPGKGNLIYVFGQNVTEMWYDNGNQLFPYQRSNSVSIDYGCLSSNTIDTMDEYVAYLGVNEKAGPVLLVSSGGPFQKISTDGIDYLFAQLVHPEQSDGFFYKISGHVFYQITFSHAADNLSLIYDFNTQKFFYLTDENMNYHIAKTVMFYNNTYYFVSLNDGCLYEMSQEFTQYDYMDPKSGNGAIFEIPRMRVTDNLEQEDSSMFIGNSFTFLFEQGVDPFYPSSPIRLITTEGGKVLTQEAPVGYIGQFMQTEEVLAPYQPRIDLSLSFDSGQTFGNTVSYPLNALGDRKNRIVFWGLGGGNSLTIQLRFWSKYRVTCSDGVLSGRMRPD
jgi:hypothetical protein